MGETNKQADRNVSKSLCSLVILILRKASLFGMGEVGNLSEETGRSKINFLRGNRSGRLGKKSFAKFQHFSPTSGVFC